MSHKGQVLSELCQCGHKKSMHQPMKNPETGEEWIQCEAKVYNVEAHKMMRCACRINITPWPGFHKFTETSKVSGNSPSFSQSSPFKSDSLIAVEAEDGRDTCPIHNIPYSVGGLNSDTKFFFCIECDRKISNKVIK